MPDPKISLVRRGKKRRPKPKVPLPTRARSFTDRWIFDVLASAVLDVTKRKLSELPPWKKERAAPARRGAIDGLARRGACDK